MVIIAQIINAKEFRIIFRNNKMYPLSWNHGNESLKWVISFLTFCFSLHMLQLKIRFDWYPIWNMHTDAWSYPTTQSDSGLLMLSVCERDGPSDVHSEHRLIEEKPRVLAPVTVPLCQITMLWFQIQGLSFANNCEIAWHKVLSLNKL